MILKTAVCPRKPQKARKDLIRRKARDIYSLSMQHIVLFRVFRVFRGLKIRTAGSASYCDL